MEKIGKKLNMFNIFCLGLGGAIGSGIFVLLGFGIGYTGRSIALVCVFGCLLMLLAYLYNVVMSSLFNFNGGDYSQKAMLFNPTMTGFSAMVTLANGLVFASYSLAAVGYIASVIPGLAPYTKLVAVLVVTLLFASTIGGSRFVTIIENVMVVVLVVAIAIFVFYGVPQVEPGFWSNKDGGFFHNGVIGVFSAMAIMGWACQGTTMAPVSMVAVTKNPKRTIPIAILWITVVLAVLYALMGYVAGGVLPYAQISGANLSVTANAIFPQTLYILFVVGGGVFAILTSALGGVAMLRYPLMQIAKDGWLPKAFTKTTKKDFPWVTQLTLYAISILPIIFGFSLDSIISLVMIPTMIMNAYLNVACISLPTKYPEQWNKSVIKMPIPFYKTVCILGGLAASFVAFNLFKDLNAHDTVACIILLAVMFGYTYLRLKQGAVSKKKLEENRITIIEDALSCDAENAEIKIDA